ncbi:MAG: chloride channel protein, partial [Planctomycetes bacterium]|nr:chloride channel protein [Planctomycetota bacterium]
MTAPTEQLAVQGQRLRNLLVRATMWAGFKQEYVLIVVAILIGAATGLFAHIFYWLIETARELAFGGGDHEGLYAGRAWMLIVLPTAGALAVGHITYFFAREAKGHGVPEVMDAIYRKGGVIRPRVAGAKAIASALTIGSGGSAGTEGPIVQIGAAIGSSIGQYLQIPHRQMGILVACGVSGGIAAIFNAPIAGVLFALEIFLRDFSFRTFSPVVFSSVISCSVTHWIRGEDEAIFEVSTLRQAGYLFPVAELPLFLVLGLVAALAAVVFIRALYFTEDLTDRIKLPEAIKPALGAIGLGLAGAIYVWAIQTPGEMPAFFGNGYPAISDALSEHVLTMTVGGLIALFILKLLATCLTLGSGGSGGIFAPSLLLGATLGAAFGMVVSKTGLIGEDSVNAYALVGMAAVVAGTTHAPLTAIVML